MKRLKRIGIVQTSKVAAIIYFFISLIMLIPFGLFVSAMGESPFSAIGLSGIFIVFLPFIYAAIAFVLTAICCFIYNLIAGWIGGIELEFEEINQMEEMDESYTG